MRCEQCGSYTDGMDLATGLLLCMDCKYEVENQL